MLCYYHDSLESRGRLEALRSRTELLKELNLDVSTEELTKVQYFGEHRMQLSLVKVREWCTVGRS
jgi:hypothetical protein